MLFDCIFVVLYIYLHDYHLVEGREAEDSVFCCFDNNDRAQFISELATTNVALLGSTLLFAQILRWRRQKPWQVLHSLFPIKAIKA